MSERLHWCFVKHHISVYLWWMWSQLFNRYLIHCTFALLHNNTLHFKHYSSLPSTSTPLCHFMVWVLRKVPQSNSWSINLLKFNKLPICLMSAWLVGFLCSPSGEFYWKVCFAVATGHSECGSNLNVEASQLNQFCAAGSTGQQGDELLFSRSTSSKAKSARARSAVIADT